MPSSIERLDKSSSIPQIKAAVTDCIHYCIKNEGLTQEQASGKCYGIAREKTGKELGKKD